MTICERLFELIDSTPDKSPAGLCRKLGINTSVTSNWRQRNTDPPAKYIAPICEYLGVSISMLLTGVDTEDDRQKIGGEHCGMMLSPDEMRLLTKYRLLDDDGKDAVRGVLLQEQRRVESGKGTARGETA